MEIIIIFGICSCSLWLVAGLLVNVVSFSDTHIFSLKEWIILCILTGPFGIVLIILVAPVLLFFTLLIKLCKYIDNKY